MKTNKITHFLSMGGCSIQVNCFLSDEQPALENYFIERMKLQFSGFILVEKPEEIAYEINIYQTYSYEYKVNKKMRLLFMGVSQQVDQKHVITNYNISDTQFQLIIRSLCQQHLVKKKGFLMHGSSVAIEGKANIFLGPSGAGKSTIMSILSNKYQPLGDDSFILKRSENNFVFYATTTKEKNAWFNKSHYPYKIANVFFLKKGDTHKSKKITDKKVIFDEMLSQLYTDQAVMDKQIKVLLSYINKFDNFYELTFSLQNKAELINMIEIINENKTQTN